MIGMQPIDDKNTYVPDWAVQFYDSGYFWLVAAIAGVIILVLIVVICRQYYELKEAKRILKE